MKIRYTGTALIEINEVFSYISERNAPAAKRVVARIEQTIQNLGDFPEMAQEQRKLAYGACPSAAIPSSCSTQ